jgi:hypothetical protein
VNVQSSSSLNADFRGRENNQSSDGCRVQR